MVKPLCKFFNTKDGCKKGDECEFRHDKTLKPLCKFFNTKDGCKKGDECEFRHVAYKTLICRYGNKCRFGKCKFYHPKTTEKRFCRYFGTKEGCKKGNDCPFLHEVKREQEKEMKKVWEKFDIVEMKHNDISDDLIDRMVSYNNLIKLKKKAGSKSEKEALNTLLSNEKMSINRELKLRKDHELAILLHSNLNRR